MSIATARQDGGLQNVERLLQDPAARPSGSALVSALAADLDAAVLVVEPDGTVRARAGSTLGARAAQAAHRAVAVGAPAGGPGSGALPGPRQWHQGWSVRMWPLAAGGARSLVAARRRPWTPPVESTAGRAATIIATALVADENDAGRDRLAGARRQVWRSVLQLLMTGQVVEAQRVAGTLKPALLDVDRVRVHVLAGRSRDRDALVGRCEQRLDGLALAIACSARIGHVIIIEPVAGKSAPPGARARVRTALSELTSGAASRSLGSSRSHPIAATANGYAEAVGALATATVRPNRMADAEESRSLTDLLPPAAGAWAAARLAPLAAADQDGTLRHTLAVALTFTRSEAAAVLGVHRNTVHARLATAAALLRADLSRLSERAAIDLALRTRPGDGGIGGLKAVGAAGAAGAAGGIGAIDGTGGSRGAAVKNRAESRGVPELADVLADPQLKIWAAGLLDRLDGAVAARGPARMRDLLRAFIRADGGITAAAYAVGLSPNSASRWLVAAEAVGGMRLRHGYGGAHEVAVALAAIEDPALLPPR